MAQRMTAARRRKDPSPMVRDEVLREAGFKCANPTCRNILTLQLHHIIWVKDGGGNEAQNLLALCGHCHDLHTQGHISETAIRHWKGLLVALNQGFSKESMDLLLYLAKPEVADVWYTSDGLLRFAGLIAAGLVEVSDTQHAASVRYGTGPLTSTASTAVRVKLSEKGQLIVDSWRTGDEDAFRKAVSR